MSEFDPRRELMHGLWVVPVFLAMFALIWIGSPA